MAAKQAVRQLARVGRHGHGHLAADRAGRVSQDARRHPSRPAADRRQGRRRTRGAAGCRPGRVRRPLSVRCPRRGNRLGAGPVAEDLRQAAGHARHHSQPRRNRGRFSPRHRRRHGQVGGQRVAAAVDAGRGQGRVLPAGLSRAVRSDRSGGRRSQEPPGARLSDRRLGRGKTRLPPGDSRHAGQGRPADVRRPGKPGRQPSAGRRPRSPSR